MIMYDAIVTDKSKLYILSAHDVTSSHFLLCICVCVLFFLLLSVTIASYMIIKWTRNYTCFVHTKVHLTSLHDELLVVRARRITPIFQNMQHHIMVLHSLKKTLN